MQDEGPLRQGTETRPPAPTSPVAGSRQQNGERHVRSFLGTLESGS